MKPTIDLLQVLKTGRLATIRVGQTQESILATFPSPDGFGTLTVTPVSDSRLSIWRFGTFELHFEGPKLVMVLCDSLHELDGGPSVDVRPWIFGEAENFGLTEVLRALVREGIDFDKRTRFGNIELVLSSGVTLHFEKDDCPDSSGGWRVGEDPWVLVAMAMRELPNPAVPASRPNLRPMGPKVAPAGQVLRAQQRLVANVGGRFWDCD